MPDRVSFYLLAELALAIDALDGRTGVGLDVLAARLRRTERQTEELVETALRFEITAIDQGRIKLTPEGHAFAASVKERAEEAEERGLEAFRPYTEYVPERWWPDRPKSDVNSPG